MLYAVRDHLDGFFECSTWRGSSWRSSFIDGAAQPASDANASTHMANFMVFSLSY